MHTSSVFTRERKLTPKRMLLLRRMAPSWSWTKGHDAVTNIMIAGGDTFMNPNEIIE